MHIKIKNGVPKKYSIRQLLSDNPQVSFPKDIPNITLNAYDVYILKETIFPQYNPLTHRVEESIPENINGQWTQVWNVIPLSEEEIAQKKEEHNKLMERQRQSSFQQEADPLFFQWQRGEIEQQVYLEKVEEIRARFPYVV